jgi:hypothetical protein
MMRVTCRGYFSLDIEMQFLDEWQKQLVESGFEIESDFECPPSSKSIDFRDPVGNSVELVTHSFWRLPSGW